MSIILPRRATVLALLALLALLLAGLALTTQRRATAQAPPETFTSVISNLVVPVDNGFSNLPEFSGSGDGVLGAECTGASPFSGSTRLPAQVITQLRTDLTYLRILNHLGAPVTGDVRVNCTLTVVVTAPQTVEKVKELARLTARQG
ncbi:MAG TPA: hypothetical protein VNK73_10530 [Actinomycetota bacterium]|nr:hypothetical protein [Actinomycetota bacterium]